MIQLTNVPTYLHVHTYSQIHARSFINFTFNWDPPCANSFHQKTYNHFGAIRKIVYIESKLLKYPQPISFLYQTKIVKETVSVYPKQII